MRNTPRTHFACSCPEPVYILDTEYGAAPVIRHFKGKKIFVFEAAVLDPDTDTPNASKSLDAVEAAISTLRELKDENLGTIVIDSGTDIWSWMGAWLEQKAAHKTSTGRPYQFEWGIANARWRQLVLRLMAKPCHFVITAQPVQVYDARGQPTELFRPRIQRQTSFMADIVLHIEQRVVPKIKKTNYVATMTKCRFERAFNVEIEDITFEKLCKVMKEKLGVIVKGAAVK